MSALVSVMVSRGNLRAALMSVVPHAGRATKDNPQLGKIRWHLDPARGELLVWAGDFKTMAAARVPCELADDAPPGWRPEQWDTTTNVVAKILRVFKESDSHHDELGIGLMLTRRGLHLSEDDGLLPGEQLRVPRIDVPEDPADDKTVDVPKALAPYLGAPASTFGEAIVTAKDMAAFEKSAKAWGGRLGMVLVDEPHPRVLVQAGSEVAFVGLMHRVDGRGDDVRNDEARTARETARTAWNVRLRPLARPEQVKVPAGVQEAVLDDVRDLLSEGIDAAGRAGFRVIRAGFDEVEFVAPGTSTHDDGKDAS